jgi:hypothetical protein
MEKICTIYGLVDPRDGSVKYVGASINPRKRHMEHCSIVYSPWIIKTQKDKWLLELHQLGLKAELKIIKECTLAESDEMECKIYEEYLLLGELYQMHPKHRPYKGFARKLSQ